MQLILVFLLALPALAADFTDRLWSGIEPTYARTVAHPFLAGLTEGDLSAARFQYYLEQDALYLGAFSRALSILAAKAPNEEWSILLNRHAIECLEVERTLHQELIAAGRAEPKMAPTTMAYTNHLLVSVSQRPFGEGLAAMLPCYWIYWEVGKELKRRGSTNAAYQRWIDQYAAADYGATVRQVVDIMNSHSASMSPQSRAAASDLFVTSARYEYMFWDMAWRLEEWP